jgi:hypothetical protein
MCGTIGVLVIINLETNMRKNKLISGLALLGFSSLAFANVDYCAGLANTTWTGKIGTGSWLEKNIVVNIQKVIGPAIPSMHSYLHGTAVIDNQTLDIAVAGCDNNGAPFDFASVVMTIIDAKGDSLELRSGNWGQETADLTVLYTDHTATSSMQYAVSSGQLKKQ